MNSQSPIEVKAEIRDPKVERGPKAEIRKEATARENSPELLINTPLQRGGQAEEGAATALAVLPQLGGAPLEKPLKRLDLHSAPPPPR